MLPPAFDEYPAAGCWSKVSVNVSTSSDRCILQVLPQQPPGDRPTHAALHQGSACQLPAQGRTPPFPLQLSHGGTFIAPNGEVPGKRDLSNWLVDSGVFPGVTSRFVLAVLLNPSAAALDQDHQHNNKQHARNDPDNRGTVHFEIPLRANTSRVQLRVEKLPQSCWVRVTGDAEAARFPAQDCGVCQRSSRISDGAAGLGATVR